MTSHSAPCNVYPVHSLGQNHKTINLSIYNIILWVAWTMGQMNCPPSVWYSKYYFFFHDLLQNSLQKSFQFIFLFFYEITKIKIKSFYCPKSIESIKRDNNWNIRLLVDDYSVPLSKEPSIIYFRLTDLMTMTGKTRYNYGLLNVRWNA